MGNLVPKLRGRKKHHRKNGSHKDQGDGARVSSGASSQATSHYDSVYEEQMVTLIRTQFHKQPHEVVLDQLLLLLPLDIDRELLESLQGAEEGADVAQVARASGAQLHAAVAASLRAQHRRAVCPDALAAAARHSVLWRAPHGPHKNKDFELLPSRLFLVQHNVAVEEYSSSSRWDPKPYSRLPGGGGALRYVLRTEEVTPHKGNKKKAGAPAATPTTLADSNRDASPPSGSVRLYVTLAPPAADPSTTERGAAGRFSEDSASARAEDEEYGAGGGAATSNGADSGLESARSSEDRGLAAVVVQAASEDECEGGPRSPTDPLPPVPFVSDDFPPQQEAPAYWAGLPTLPATPVEDRKKVLGPAPHRQPRSKQGGGRRSATRQVMPVERRLSGVAPVARGRGRGRGRGRVVASLPSAQPPPSPPPSRSDGTPLVAGPRSSGGSSRTSEDTDYGYAGSTGSGRGPPTGSTRQSPPSSSSTTQPLREGEIPPQCFQDVYLPRLEVAYTEDEEDEDPCSDVVASSTLFIRRRYLLPDAYLQAVDAPRGLETPAACVVRPALPQAEWPSRLQLHWNTRQRVQAVDPRTHKTRQWPSPAHIDKVRSLGCLLVPSESGGKNEWHYMFPAAEAYLESSLSGSHIRVFLAAAALVRASAEETALSDGAWVQWLRHTFFWLCERDCLDMCSWERPGRALWRLLDSFYLGLMRKRLKDYFVPARNLLEDADTTNIRVVQERLSRVRENLLVHVVGAARSLKPQGALVTTPPFDFRRFHQMLTSENFVIILNPSLGWSLEQHQHGGESLLSPGRAEDPDEGGAAEAEADASSLFNDDSDGEGEAAARGGNDEVQEWARKFRVQLEAEWEAAAAQLEDERRPSLDSIDLKAPLPRVWDPLRRRLVSETLSEALVERGTWAHYRGWPRLARVCARQAARMARLMEETEGADPAVASALRQRANNVEQMCNLTRRHTHQQQDHIEVHRSNTFRSPICAEAGSSAEGSEKVQHCPRSVPSLTLRGTTSGESLVIVEEDETADDKEVFKNRRYSTIAEVHAELAVLRAGTTDDKSEENQEKDVESLTHNAPANKINSRNNSGSSDERKTSNSSPSSIKTTEETTENKGDSLDKHKRGSRMELEPEKNAVSEIMPTQERKENDQSDAGFDNIQEQDEEEEDDLDMRL